jgi:hypothetical protein
MNFSDTENEKDFCRLIGWFPTKAKNVILETCVEFGTLKKIACVWTACSFFWTFPTCVGKCVGTRFYTKSDVGKLLRK